MSDQSEPIIEVPRMTEMTEVQIAAFEAARMGKIKEDYRVARHMNTDGSVSAYVHLGPYPPFKLREDLHVAVFQAEMNAGRTNNDLKRMMGVFIALTDKPRFDKMWDDPDEMRPLSLRGVQHALNLAQEAVLGAPLVGG